MDLAKLIDKFFGFLSGLVPGSVVLLIMALHRPEAWSDFWKVNYLGYQTKITILFAFALIAGSTVNSVVGAIIGGIQSGVAGYQAEKRAAQAQEAAAAAQRATQIQQKDPATETAQASTPATQPQQAVQVPPVAASPPEYAYWRDVNWRNLVSAYLGKAAPENLQEFHDQAEVDRAIQIAQNLPALEQARELNKIARRINQRHLQENDELWRECWYRLNGVMSKVNDPQMKMGLILVSAYGGASLLLLLAAPWTPALRHWWILLPCLYYVFVATAQAVIWYARSQDPAQLFDQQWQYLQTHVGKSEQPNSLG
jgi:hypothetical protein